MDPITAIGLLASLAELIRASNSMLEMVRRLKDSDGELENLVDDIAIFAESLKGCDRVLRSRQAIHNISPMVIQKAIEDGAKSIRDLQGHVDQVTSSNNPTMRRLRWMQIRPRLQKLQSTLREHIVMLQSFVSLAHT